MLKNHELIDDRRMLLPNLDNHQNDNIEEVCNDLGLTNDLLQRVRAAHLDV